MSTPRVRNAAASRATVAASGVVASPTACAASVCRKPLSVIMPIRPTRTPATSTIADGTTFGQRTGCPLAASTMLAARNGKRARAAAALRAPCRSLGSAATIAFGSHSATGVRDRRSRSRSRGCRWRAPCSRSRCRRRRPCAPSDRFDSMSALERVAGVEHQHRAAVGCARGAQVVDEAAEHRQTAAALVIGEQTAVQIVGADDRDRDFVGRGSGRGGRQRANEREQERRQRGAQEHRPAR